jgi:hypothetical protein
MSYKPLAISYRVSAMGYPLCSGFSEGCGKDMQKVLPPEDWQSSGFLQWGHSEILPGQRSRFVGIKIQRRLFTERSKP